MYGIAYILQTDRQTDRCDQKMHSDGRSYKANNVHWHVHAFNRAEEWKAMRNVRFAKR